MILAFLLHMQQTGCPAQRTKSFKASSKFIQTENDSVAGRHKKVFFSLWARLRSSGPYVTTHPPPQISWNPNPTLPPGMKCIRFCETVGVRTVTSIENIAVYCSSTWICQKIPSSFSRIRVTIISEPIIWMHFFYRVLIESVYRLFYV